MTVYNTGGAIGCLQLATDIKGQNIEHQGTVYRISKNSRWDFYASDLFCGGAPASFSIREIKSYKGLIRRVLGCLNDKVFFGNSVAFLNFDLNDASKSCGFGKDGIDRILYMSIHQYKSPPAYLDQRLRSKLTDAIWDMVRRERREVYDYLADFQKRTGERK
jgi:hypothetical protein